MTAAEHPTPSANWVIIISHYIFEYNENKDKPGCPLLCLLFLYIYNYIVFAFYFNTFPNILWQLIFFIIFSLLFLSLSLVSQIISIFLFVACECCACISNHPSSSIGSTTTEWPSQTIRSRHGMTAPYMGCNDVIGLNMFQYCHYLNLFQFICMIVFILSLFY